MKTFKILFAAVIIAGFATSATAQLGDNQAVAEASATILQDIEVQKVADINFGIIDPTATSPQLTLNVLDDNNHGDRIGLYDSSANLGKFSINGQTNNVDVIISWVFTDLEFEGATLGWNPVVGFNLQDEDSATKTIESGDDEELVEGVGYVYVGGSLSTPDQAPGEYSGDFTLTVEYN